MGRYKLIRCCRWCGRWYTPKRNLGRDGFCCVKHRVALNRAFRRWLRNSQALSLAFRKKE